LVDKGRSTARARLWYTNCPNEHGRSEAPDRIVGNGLRAAWTPTRQDISSESELYSEHCSDEQRIDKKGQAQSYAQERNYQEIRGVNLPSQIHTTRYLPLRASKPRLRPKKVDKLNRVTLGPNPNVPPTSPPFAASKKSDTEISE